LAPPNLPLAPGWAFVCRHSRPIDEAHDEVYRAPSARHEIEYRSTLFSTIHNLYNCEIMCILVYGEFLIDRYG
jgi:hypothetical protein